MKRIKQLDFFRGVFLIIITINHILPGPNILKFFTHGFIGWVTAAEGFVFLSGLTAGVVYSRKLVEKGEGFIAKAAVKRSWAIYKYHLLLFIFIATIISFQPIIGRWWLHNMEDYKLLFHSPGLAILLGSTMLYQPSLLDILPMYAIYMLLLPLTLKYFQRGKGWVVLAISFLMYLMSSFDLASRLFGNLEPISQINTGFFDLFSWQFLFIAGLYLGFLTYQNKVGEILKNKRFFFISTFVFALLFILNIVNYSQGLLSVDLNYWAGRGQLRPLRLLNFFSLLGVVSYIASRFKEWFTFKPICYLGKHSLEVFAFHVILVIIFKPFLEYTNSFHKVQISKSFYIYPWSTIILVLILIPALFLAPFIKKSIKDHKLKAKYSS